MIDERRGRREPDEHPEGEDPDDDEDRDAEAGAACVAALALAPALARVTRERGLVEPHAGSPATIASRPSGIERFRQAAGRALRDAGCG